MPTHLNLSNVDLNQKYLLCVHEDKDHNDIITAKQRGRSWTGIMTWLDSHIFHRSAYKLANVARALAITEWGVVPSSPKGLSNDIRKIQVIAGKQLNNYCRKHPNEIGQSFLRKIIEADYAGEESTSDYDR